MKTMIRGALAATALGAASVAAQAADLPSIKAPPPPPPVFDTYQPFQVRLSVSGVVPTDGGSDIFDAGAFHPALAQLGVPFGSTTWATGLGGPGAQVPGASTTISWSVIPTLDVAYFLTKNWAIEAICCVSPHHIQGTGVLSQGDLGRAWLFPPSLTIQYHFTNFGAFQPYLGVGVNFTTFWGVRAGNNQWPLYFAPGSTVGVGGPLGTNFVGANASFYSLNITDSWGVVGQAGFDYMLNEHWGINFDFKYIQMETGANARIAAFIPQGIGPLLGAFFIPVHGNVRIDPIIVSTGLTYRFGGGAPAPVVAKY